MIDRRGSAVIQELVDDTVDEAVRYSIGKYDAAPGACRNSGVAKHQ
jgi:hypothetical protein